MFFHLVISICSGYIPQVSTTPNQPAVVLPVAMEHVQKLDMKLLESDRKLLIIIRDEIRILQSRTDRDWSANLNRLRVLEERTIQQMERIRRRAGLPIPRTIPNQPVN